MIPKTFDENVEDFLMMMMMMMMMKQTSSKNLLLLCLLLLLICDDDVNDDKDEVKTIHRSACRRLVSPRARCVLSDVEDCSADG